MSRIFYVLPLFIAILLSFGNAYGQIGQETRFDRELRTNDDQPLREFVESKENIDVREKSKNLEISGDVRFFWQNVQEKGLSVYRKERSAPSGSSLVQGYVSSDDFSPVSQDYRAFRGGSHVGTDGVPLSKNIFDVEFNLKIKYTYKKSWAMAQLQFDNPAGVRASFRCDDVAPLFNSDGSSFYGDLIRDRRQSLKGSGLGAGISLKKAYIGYNVWADGENRFDIEVGRRKLNDVFDSEIQFSNYFDGVLLKYATAFGKYADFYWNFGGFVIDQRVDHFGYVTEFGFLDIYETGFDFRYSFIDWRNYGHNRCDVRNAYGTRFANSQITLTYTINPKICSYELPVEFYSGFVLNHAARKNKFTKDKKENLGWYAGIYIGNVDEEGDWSFDIEYAVVQAQAVPDPDVSSIGRGNIFNDFIFDEWLIPPVVAVESGSSSSYSSDYVLIPRRGNGNFIGWRGEFLYALTDNLTVDLVYQWSKANNNRIGGRHYYQDFELEIIYAF